MLDYFGDIGGLIEGLSSIFEFISGPFMSFMYSSFMLRKLFRLRPKGYQMYRGQKNIQHITSALKTMPSISKTSFLAFYFCRWR